MSTELTKARSQISQVKSHLKQDKIIPAVQSMLQALVIIAKNPLMKQEKEEFTTFVNDALHQFYNNAEFKKHFPLKMEYAPGKEREMVNNFRELLNELQKQAVDQAQSQLSTMAEKKAEGVKRGQELIDAGRFDEARDHFKMLVRDFPNDPELKADVGERFLRVQRYEEAYDFLAQALEDSPESTHLYNRIGIALRKLGKFEVAEKYYAKALSYVKDDPNLFFNIGRLYIDWRKWDKVARMAKRALKHNPDFAEARKMLAFAEKKMGKN
jgi:tetratricopeptide (TPR) repeat protein